jgi:hypothetical protein
VRRSLFALRLSGALLIAAGMLSAPGCIGFMSHMLYWMGANAIPAECSALKGKSTVVVCESPHSSYGPDADADLLAREIGKLLTYSADVKIVRQDDVAAWVDKHGAHQLDYKAIGKALKAERVLAVKLNSLSMHENATIYQGKADYILTVHDTATGEVLFERQQPDFAYPEKGGAHITEMPEGRFRLEFIKWLANDIARLFHANELTSQFAGEPRLR